VVAVSFSQSAVVSNATVVESYDDNYTYQSSIPAPLAGTINVWDLGDLPPGYTTNIVIKGQVSKKALAADVLFNTAEVFSKSGSRTVHLVTRVINDPPIPVTLLFFRAVTEEAGVKLKWETATEFENLGFNLYRATSATGSRIKLNSTLIRSSDSSDGALYKFIDTGAKPEKTYYYWLEEVAWNLKTTLYGPEIREGTAATVVSDPAAFGVFTSARTGGLHRITYETLVVNGIEAGKLNPNSLAVRVNGRQTPLFMNADGPVMQPGDFLLFYVPASKRGKVCEISTDRQPARMDLADARPNHKVGDVYVDQAGLDQRVAFETDPSIVRYFLHDFTSVPVWLVDVSVPTNAVLMAGYSYVEVTNGLTAVYLSYGPKTGSASCEAFQDSAVIEIISIKQP
jgi:hypothetical protein